jgi:hypothetical protein
LGEIIDACFVGAGAVEDSIVFCRQVKAAIKEYRLYPFTNRHLFESLFRTQPLSALDEFLGDEPESSRLVIKEIDLEDGNPLRVVPTDVLIAWAQVDPSIRFPKLAAAVNPIKEGTGNGAFVWSEFALKMLDLAPDRLAVLKEFGTHFRPRSYRDSLADTIENRRVLPQSFFTDSDPKVVAWARESDAELGRWAQQERLSDRRTDERFE